MRETESRWLADVSEVPIASDESLKRQLITPDGRGEKMKTAALEELLRRAREEGTQAKQ